MKAGFSILTASLAVSLAHCVPKDGAVASGGSSTDRPSAPAPAGGNLLKQSDFNDGKSLPWMMSFTAPGSGNAAIQDGAYCLNVSNKGVNPWDAQFRHREMVIQKGHTYTIQFVIYSSAATKVRPKIGMSGPPYKEYWNQTIDVTPTPQVFKATFEMGSDDDPTAEFAFHAGGALAQAAGQYSVCIDDIYLSDPQFTAVAGAGEEPVPNVRVNQIGYLPKLAKHATINNAATSPVDFEVVDGSGKAVHQGKTTVKGQDPDSGEHLHLADFSVVTAPGQGYVVRVGNDASHPFDIGTDLYSQMKYDALAYFYHNRSGIEIKMPFAREEKWARPAGHAESDKAVPCWPDTGCNYKLDVTGGWYDAGDHGKYVVNGGISVWTLLNLYERAKHIGKSEKDFGDNKLNIPESGNGRSDLLDEVRWQLEWMMKMQIPAGKPKAGMVHHKMHDLEWTALGIAPHEAEKKSKRYLRPPSTAATLNLAAAAAQCARVYKAIDARFANKCLKAAETAWAAAKKNPSVYAPKHDTGGGPYDDNDVTDEFYWAAAELFITTGKAAYKNEITSSPHHKSLAATSGGAGGGAATAMTWQSTAACGTISLAVAPNQLGKPGIAKVRKQLTQTADMYLTFIDLQGHRLPLKSPKGYPWGSNSMVLNNMIVLGLAHDFTGDPSYLNGVHDGMAYLLGRNPLGQSYVSGYGEKPLRNPHHRFWSKQVDGRFPSAPPGAVSGGPNSSIQDPYAKAAGLEGCVPQKCFVDHIESWSTNEITINWNSPFAWVTHFLDEMGKK